MFSPFFHHLHWDVGEASASTDGAFSDTVADAMTHAGTVAAQGAGIDAAQAGGGMRDPIFFSWWRIYVSTVRYMAT